MTSAALDAQEQLTGLDPNNPDDCAHFVDQRPVERGGTGQDIAEAMIFGFEVTALCGYTWIPSRDHQGRPVCKACLDEYGRIGG